MVYEQSDSLAPVVEKFKLKLQQSPLLPRQVPQQALASLGPLGNEIAGCTVHRGCSEEQAQHRHRRSGAEHARCCACAGTQAGFGAPVRECPRRHRDDAHRRRRPPRRPGRRVRTGWPNWKAAGQDQLGAGQERLPAAGRQVTALAYRLSSVPTSASLPGTGVELPEQWWLCALQGLGCKAARDGRC